MDDASPWKEVAARFAKIGHECEDKLCANWISSGWKDPTDTWYLSGIDSPRVHEHFKWAAQRAAVHLGQQPGPASLFFWLDLLRKDTSSLQEIRHYGNNQAGLEEEVAGGIIPFLCTASEEYCFKLETEYVAKEPARRQKEVFRKLIERHRETSAGTPLAPNRSEVHQAVTPSESVAEQLRALRQEARMTIDELASEVNIDARSVRRHLSGRSVPRIGHIGAYERAISKRLGRKVVIVKMSCKRP